MNNTEPKENSSIKNIIKGAIPYVIIVIAVILLRTFVVTPVIVDGDSMNDTLKDGQILLLKKYDKNFERFDIVVFEYEDSKLVKRIIGLPGDHVEYEDGVLYINGEIIEDQFASITGNFDLQYLGYDKVPDGYYFVMGDNRTRSVDSRRIGLIKEENIDGITDFRIWPFGKVK